MKIGEVAKLLELNIKKENILLNEQMAKHTSFKIGGTADIFINIKEKEELRYILKIANENNIPIFILGNGTNLLVNDNGIRGIVVKTDFDKIEIELNKNEVTVGSGLSLGFIAQKLLNYELTGFEELSGIPGTIGGAVKQNAGAHGKEIKDVLISIIAMDYKGNEFILNNSELDFSYRSSILKEKKYIVLEAKLKLELGNKDKIKEKMEEYKKWRKEKQPLEYPNAGSTFKRGEDYITAKLIDECGLKGYQIGGAEISAKHAGFIVNKGNATAKDVIDLIEYTKRLVKEKFEKDIQLEIEVVGE